MDSEILLEDDDEDEDDVHPETVFFLKICFTLYSLLCWQSSAVLGHRFQSDDWVSSTLKASEQAFEKRFQDVFNLHKKGYDMEHRAFAMRALTDMLGSIG